MSKTTTTTATEVKKAPEGWTTMHDDRNGGLHYIYPEGHELYGKDFHMTHDEVVASVMAPDQE